MSSIPADVLARIKAWRSLPEDERTERLRSCVVYEVVGNMRMEGQPVSEAWIERHMSPYGDIMKSRRTETR